MLPEGFGNISSASMSLAVQRVLAQLYRGIEEAIAPVTDMIPEKEWRNQEIFRRYMDGERAIDLGSSVETCWEIEDGGRKSG